VGRRGERERGRIGRGGVIGSGGGGVEGDGLVVMGSAGLAWLAVVAAFSSLSISSSYSLYICQTPFRPDIGKFELDERLTNDGRSRDNRPSYPRHQETKGRPRQWPIPSGSAPDAPQPGSRTKPGRILASCQGMGEKPRKMGRKVVVLAQEVPPRGLW
jgi:hypothetical protein